MKRVLIFAVVALLTACGGSAVKVRIANSVDIARNDCTVELEWESIAAAHAGLNPDEVVVRNDAGIEIPSQVIFEENVPQSLIFQADVEASGQVVYTITSGRRADYPRQAYCRAVPERYDDYAWENNVTAYRAYAEALEFETVSPGIDVWVKSTDSLVIDKWFASKDYHTNHGQGMDCYKVGTTLGGGASAPYSDGQLVFGRNYVKAEQLADGPVRAEFVLEYAPFDVDGCAVVRRKKISIDANTNFFMVTDVYTGDFDTLSVAAGAARHNVESVKVYDYGFAMTEEVSDSRNPERDGDISVAVIMPAAEQVAADLCGHALAIATLHSGEPLTYYAGSGWSGGNVADAAAWEQMTELAAQSFANPLTVTLEP